uniref:LPS-assembly protein LptD n=1 Tax=Candidatus Kentrum sp. MB TaxID=2138164 RepID=A0A450XHL8_9GAMM|nr:MAG: LPS-assembly protein [Candidatus Kentron sp. MB]VFK28807.1 MAG: LPS-assembly protein [Candidatus Kentron sp. MB]VFK74105.1 MAG: LPS-assembly protein [Candidatus Kentron sp. MB]
MIYLQDNVIPRLPFYRTRLVRSRVLAILAIIVVWVCGTWTAALSESVLAPEDSVDNGPDWSLCESDYWIPPRHPVVDMEGGDPSSIYLSADESSLLEQNILTMKGNVEVRQGDKYLSADLARYNKSAGTVDIQGNVEVWEVGRYVSGESAHIDLSSKESRLENASFLLMDKHGHGTARRVHLPDSNRMTARNATYTTCTPSPGRFGAKPANNQDTEKTESWWLTAKKIKVDKVKDSGTARNVTVKLKNIPIFYTPYLTFPLSDKRKTGFLVPGFGISDINGVEITTPFYWNIAPEQDATFAIRAMADRGAMLQGEYRYLTRIGTGKVGLEFLPDDALRDENRTAFRFQHTGNLSAQWHTDMDFNWISDKNYFEDMGTSLDMSSTRFFERRADLRYSGDRWWAHGRIQGYQVVDDTILPGSRPYEQLPQLQFGTRFAEHNRTFNFQFQGEWVNFQRRTGVTGTRLDLTPSVSYPMRTASTFLIPKLSLRHTQYNLSGTEAGKPDSPTRTLPIFSLDSGIFLDREMRLGKRAYTHTLEPRLHYLFVPYDNQDDFPVFDTSEYTFNFGTLFREHRFSGGDRVGDTHQVSLALTTRLLDEQTAEEIFRVSVGQIQYLQDRKVHLLGKAVDTDNSSEIITEVAAKIANQWRFLSGLQYSVQDNTATRTNFSLRYKPDEQRVFNLGYRYDRAHEEQANTSFRWPLGKNWGAVGRWTYALPESRTMETVIGLEYDSCCWGARALMQRFLSSTDGDFSNAFFLQLELKGLAGIGRKTDRFLERTVPGYRNRF